MLSGSVKFVYEEIDTGDLSLPPPTYASQKADRESPYGVWGALGTRNGVEVISAPGRGERSFGDLMFTPFAN